jgi:heat-inducible transcriptional repressor
MTQFAAPLTPRQIEIALAVVREHVRTREPVGSLVVRERYGINASPATIRNEMAELEAAGYLFQPHTSAGRIPSDSAYRLYVNYLLATEQPEETPLPWVEGEYRRLGDDPQELLRETSRLLARLTSHPAVVTAPPKAEPKITAIRLQPVSVTTVLLLYKTSDGEEHHHLLRTSGPVTAQQVAAFSQALHSLVEGKRVSALTNLSLPSVQAQMHEPTFPEELLRGVIEAASMDDDSIVYVDGTSYILDEPEFEERETLRSFMQTLDEDSALKQVLRAALDSQSITVTIGGEHHLPGMARCSLVAGSYSLGEGRGAVAILGPTRMDYSRAMQAVALMVRKLSQALEDMLH